MLEKKKIKELKDKIEELEKVCDKHKQQLKTHEEMLIKASKIINAMDKTMAPIYEHYVSYIKDIQTKKEDSIKDMYR